MFKYEFVANLPLSLSAKEFKMSVNFGGSYGQAFSVLCLTNGLCTKFEVSRCTGYEAMNGGTKCRKLDGFGWLRVTRVHGQCHRSIERIRLPI